MPLLGLNTSRFVLAAATGACMLLGQAGCERIRTAAQKVANPINVAPDYLTPPAPTGSSIEANGNIRIQGTAPAKSSVSLRSPEGESAEARTDTTGHWATTLAPVPQPRLYAFEASIGGRTVRAEGALCVLTLPMPAIVVLRAGSGAAVLGAASDGVLVLSDIDFDGGGGVAAAGLGPSNTPVRLTIDGLAAGVAQADALGRFSVMALDPRHAPIAGLHRIGVQTPSGGGAVVEVSVSPPTPLSGTEIYRAARIEGGWRIDWRIPGGGAQTSLVFDPPVQARSSPARQR